MRHLLFVFALLLTLPTLATAKDFNGNHLKGKYVCQGHSNRCRDFKIKAVKIVFKSPKCVVRYTTFTANDRTAILYLSLKDSPCNPGFDMMIFIVDDSGTLHVGLYTSAGGPDDDSTPPDRYGIFVYNKA